MTLEDSEFLVLSDTHFYAPGCTPEDKTWWNRALKSRAPEIAECLVDTVRELKPDFIIHCGDFTGYGDLQNFDFGCQVMDAMGAAWFAVPGNHDSWFPGVRAGLAQRAGLPGERCYFARELGGLRFIFLDVVSWHNGDGLIFPYKQMLEAGKEADIGPTPEQLAWLEAELQPDNRLPVVIVSHAPLAFRPVYRTGTKPKGIPAPQGQISLVERMGDMALRNEVRSILRRSNRVALALAGHWHIHDVLREDGITFCQTAALREYPFELRRCRVRRNQIEVSTVGLNDATWQRLSYIEEWGNSWVAGGPGERKFTAPLPLSKATRSSLFPADMV